MWERLLGWAGILLLVLLAAEGDAAAQPAPCDKSRKVFTESWGIVTDGPIGANYTQDSHCEWLIKANNSNQFITLSFRSMGTECSYDYVFVYDGSSFNSPLLGSFSGKTEPQQVTATSGSMLILLYSDTNYVLDGFRAEFSVTDCPRNCSDHGVCVRHACACDGDWGGRDCGIKLCPENCGVSQGRGVCRNGQCVCNKGYSGQACSLSRTDTVGRSWHHLSHSENGFSPRAAHSVVYINETDALYVFGGFDLNHVLGDLVIYRFATSRWEDEDGKPLDGTAVWSAPLDPPTLAAVLEKGEQRWGLPPKSSLFHAVLRSVKDNATFSIRRKLDERGQHLVRIPRETTDVDDLEGLTTLQPDLVASQQTEINAEDIPTTEQTPLPTPTSTNPPSSTPTHIPNIPKRPAPRYGHAACRSAAGMVLYGGKLSDGSLSGDLWLYDFRQHRWSLRAIHSKIRPPRLTRHTLTLADGYLYLFGGSTPGGDFSSQLFRIRIISGEKGAEEEQWEEVRPRGGKELDVRVVAHSTVYHAYSNCLIVYGGVVAGVKRYSKLSDRMFAFQLDSRHWAELSYPRAHLPDTYVPRERAFHTSSIIGNYLVVFGGYSHRHNKEEICYDSQLYLYHLGCHTWVNHEVFGTAEKVSRYPKQQGVFAHAAAVRNGNTLLIVGGYHGNVNADLLAFVLPPTLASREGEPYEPEQSCVKHLARTECTANPECGWCSVDDTCYGRTVGVNCTTNLQVTRCLGICPALGDCHSCLVHGVTWNPTNVPGGPPMGESSGMLGSAAHKLRLGQCTWCVQNARCHHKDDNYGVCGVREDTPSPIPGWWGPKGTEVTKVHECSMLDRRPGLTFVQYKHPANWSQPDLVSIMNATTVDFNLGSSQWPYVERGGGVHIARLMGSLLPPESWDDSHETLRMCASYSTAVLRVAHFPDSNDTTNPIQNAHLEEVGNLTAEQSRCMSAVYAPGKPVLLNRGRYLVDFESRKIQSAEGTHLQSKMELQHNRSQENAKVFTFEYLAPYENGSCWQYSNCLACLTDSACGWCEVSNSCLDRKLNETEACRSPNSNDWHYLTLQPAACPNCSNYISCDSCLVSQLCEWWTKDARCTRRGRSEGAVVDVTQCPAPCHTRKNCSRCLEERGVCVWCEATQECFSFSVYTSEYQFGLCREWLDQAYHGVAGSVSGSLSGPGSSLVGGMVEPVVSPNVPSQQCKWCGRHDNCSSCLHTLGCGWCYSADNPIVGVCVEGDFNEPHVESCSAAIAAHSKTLGSEEDVVALFGNSSLTGDALWAYAQCPDVDECDLKIHDCHPQAICTNTHGSYNCQCQRGYNGDGRTTCTRTCYYNCVNGYCVGAPDYSCKCDLGWTGVDCATNCGCNNHSTCSQGVGKCDQCQDWTTGEFCQYCRTGSYGNATNGQGCHGCHCNEHGSEALGVCNFQTGECFCQDNTQGWNCESCQKGYYGDPRNGGMCYYQCMARGMMTGLEQQGLGSRLVQTSALESRVAGASPSECLWIISPFHTDNHTETIREGIIQLTIHSDINVPCQENSVYVYDGQIDLSTNVAIHQSHVLGVFCSQDTTYPVTVEATSGIMTVHYKQGDISEGFNASYVVLSCPDHCPENRTCVSGQCLCPEGWSGPNCASALCPNNCSADGKRGVCDKSYGRCICSPEWGGLDCSEPINLSQLVFTELFNSEHISEAGTLSHWRKMLPRLGHTLSADRRGDLWMFGGYSLSHGALNDIRLFDTKNNTWMQITVDSTSDAKMPRGRYFHAAEIVQSRREIYIFGGMVVREGEHNNAYVNSSLSDTWKFALKSQRWIQIETEVRPPPLSGHTLTLRRTGESESLLLIGGFSPRFGFLNVVWEFDLERETWSILNTSGNQPLGVYGHSTVYHAPTQSLFVFGGYMYAINRTFISNKLYALHYPTRTWSVVPPFKTYNPAELNLPRARFLHTAITTDDYMLVFGGRTHPLDTSDSMVAYTYSCNQWVRLVSRDVDLVGSPPPPTYAHAMTVDPDSGSVYVMGGFDGGIQSRVTRITVPKDLCALWPQRERCRLPGCSYCAVYHVNGNNSSYCFRYNAGNVPDACANPNGTVVSNNGIVCNEAWMAGACEQYSTCSECLARWPSNFDSQSCKWCSNLPRGHCVDKGATCESKEREIADVSQCIERQCPASDCEQCGALGNCVWTRQVQYTAELGVKVNSEPVYDWNCVGDGVLAWSSIKLNLPTTCPSRCSEYKTCDTCLTSKGAEGGWHECRWSTQLRECISPSYQAMYCAGGVCGLVLRGGDVAHCPEPCSTYTKCSDCHLHSRCGWCALNAGNNTGRGVCTEGSPDGPARPCSEVFLQKSPRSSAALGQEFMLMQGSDYNVTTEASVAPSFTYEFMKCPPENECENGHHTCDLISEECVDEHDRFRCICGRGYRAEKSSCVPVCSQGCVRGTCVEPNKCLCDFGYVGANCSIQCQCNGHSNCAGPDKLDQCLQCHNNTKGPQCERCKPLFVGDPTNNGQCVPCIEYCNGHTPICVNNSIINLPDLPPSELENFLVEGPTSHARCIGCANRTAGDKCEDCIQGNFRGSEDHRDPCRPCECHGHGHLCDAVTGERCNCQNNTESDPQCQSSLGKGPNQCWKMQCSKCRESFMGTPTGGHQCYKQMNVDLKFCLDAKLIEECKTKPRPLNPGQAVFFVVQPRYMNVDIRVIVDVTQGAIDLYLSPRDDTFVVNVHPLTGEHIIDMDQRYLWHPEEYEELPGGSRISRVEVISPSSVIGDNITTERSTLRHSNNAQVFLRHEQNARGLTSFITVDQKNTFLVVRNLRDRLILTLPHDIHNLSQTRFFVALVARNSPIGIDDPNAGQPSYGMIFFRQDQLHIDLFVFFSVFFSCFFLFIAVCVVGWKAKQAADIRRARRRHVVEMLHMAKRPFATLTLLLEPNSSERPTSSASSIQSQTVSPHRKKLRGAGGHLGGGHLGGNAANRFSAGAGVRPVAVEPTDDGVAAVSTVFVRLPGGQEAPVRLAIASSLILLSRNHPINSRTFLRRRSINAPS